MSDFNEIWIFSTDFSNIMKYQMHDNPSNGSRVVSFIQTDGRRDMMKFIVTFRNFANAPTNTRASHWYWPGRIQRNLYVPWEIAPESCAIELSIYGRAYYASVNGTFHIWSWSKMVFVRVACCLKADINDVWWAGYKQHVKQHVKRSSLRTFKYLPW